MSDEPTNYEAYNPLASALSRRAHESSDPSFYEQAGDALQKSLEISPGNLDAEKIRVSTFWANTIFRRR